MMKNNLIKSVFFIIALFLAIFFRADASASGIDVNLHVGGYCNNNGMCEAGDGEDILSCPSDCTPVVPPVTGGGGGSGSIGNYFNDLTVEVSYNSAVIKWKSTVPTISNLKWGTNPDYRDGSIRNIKLLIDHKVELFNLKDGTIYYFSIQSENLSGISKTLDSQTFQTLSLPDTTPPGNPTNVRATSASSGILLSWKNPKDEDFEYVRIMRNDGRFYASPYLGTLIYEGKEEYATDVKVKEGHKYFYTLFSRDRAGNYSSGSLVSLIYNPKGLDDWGTVIPPKEELEKVEASFVISQNSSVYDFIPGGVFHLNGDTTTNIKTNYSSKIINDDLWVEIRNSDGSIIGQYFFEKTRDKSGFVNVIIPSFERGGYYNVRVYKYTNGAAGLINYGSFDISKAGEKKVAEWTIGEILFLAVVIFLVIIILFLIIVLLKRKISSHFRKNKEGKS